MFLFGSYLYENSNFIRESTIKIIWLMVHCESRSQTRSLYMALLRGACQQPFKNKYLNEFSVAFPLFSRERSPFTSFFSKHPLAPTLGPPAIWALLFQQTVICSAVHGLWIWGHSWGTLKVRFLYWVFMTAHSLKQTKSEG